MKTRLYNYLLLPLGFIITASFALATGDELTKIRTALEKYLIRNAEEKVYIQTDKTLYQPGEYIFFNTFLPDASTGEPSQISEVVYAELYDPKGSLAKKLTLTAVDGMAGGEFFLDEKMAGGIYIIKGYTSWMTNFGEDRTFTKEIQVQKVITPRLLLKPDFEKKAYGPGDEVTAKLEVTDLKNEKAIDALIKVKVRIAGNAYTEFTSTTNAEGKALLKFLLPETLDSPDGLLQAIVTYQGIEESVSRAIPIVLNKIDLTFYPEGGTWISGVPQRMAFEALNEFGKGADVSGEIVDEQGRKVAGFESFHFGMGTFEMTPESGKRYAARILRPKGNETLRYLPECAPQGYAMNLKSHDSTSITWRIVSPTKTNAYLVSQVHGIPYQTKTLSLQQGENIITCETQALPAGIAVATLFDVTGQPQCERLVLVNPDKHINIEITTDKQFYQPDETVKATISTKDENGLPITANLSMAVVDEQLLTMADDKQDNILTYLLLSSELHGKIHEPSFYFNKKEEKSAAAIDYLLLTHGWRRFSWNDVLTNKDKIRTPAEGRTNNVYGLVVNKNGKPVQAEVILIEATEQKRALKVTTTKEGQFAFFNIDPNATTILYTKKPNRIILQSKQPASVQTGINVQKKLQELAAEQEIAGSIPKANTPVSDATVEKQEESGKNNTELKTNVEKTWNYEAKHSIIQKSPIFYEDESDALSGPLLDEIVVTNYGSFKKNNLTDVVAIMQSSNIDVGSLPSALAGQVAGVLIQPQSSNVYPDMNIRIRGIGSLNNSSEPLYVIDGVPADQRTFSSVNPNNIKTISVWKDAEATSIYGSRGANGVIVVATGYSGSYGNYYSPYHSKKEDEQYNALMLPSKKDRAYYFSKDYYELVPRIKTNSDSIRQDFRTTVYWKNRITTGKDGLATFSFFNNDATSAFRITAEGVAGNGLIGRTEHTYSTQLPLSLDAKLPNYLSFADTLRIPVSIRNNTKNTLRPTVHLTVPQALKAISLLSMQRSIAPETSEVVIFTIVSNGQQGLFPIDIRLKHPEFSDVIKHNLAVYPIGFPHSYNLSGRDMEKSGQFAIEDMEPGTLQGTAMLHINTLDELIAATQSILREPYGCFEQVSSATFPNIFVMQLMNATGQGDETTRKKAMQYIKNGYAKLAAYESSGGGFEWYGGSPGHEVLTAYGLIEFYEMKKLGINVNTKMIERAINFLKNRRNDDGTYKQNRGKYGFSAAPEVVNNAYIAYALAEIGQADEQAYTHALEEALQSKDMYRMALMANAAAKMNHTADYNKLVTLFNHATANGFANLKAESSIVYGSLLPTETTALWAIALIRADNPNWAVVEKCINYITSKRSYYGYGSTQATALSLQALTDYAIMQQKATAGHMTLLVNNTKYDFIFNEKTKSSIVNTGFVKSINTTGTNTISVKFDNAESTTPYSVIIQWNTYIPESSGKCPLRLTTTLSQTKMKQNETVRLNIKLQNTKAVGQPMSMAVIGIPAGLSAQPWQLKELQEKGVFDFYEILDNRLALYYREMGPSETRTINLDLKGDIPGTYIGAASSGYLYYTQEERHWVNGLKIVIE